MPFPPPQINCNSGLKIKDFNIYIYVYFQCILTNYKVKKRRNELF